MPIARKFKKSILRFSIKDKIWDNDLVDMQLIYKYNTGILVLL